MWELDSVRELFIHNHVSKTRVRITVSLVTECEKKHNVLSGSGREEHAEGGEPHPQDHHDLQAAGRPVCCAGDHDCFGFLRFQVTKIKK